MVSQSLIAYQKIKEMIFHMEFTAGTRIPESIFSSKLNISRTPIRDALRRLEAEGLVVIELNRGATVREFSDHEVREIGEVRMMQDILSAQLASYYGSAAEFNHLYTLADICEEARYSIGLCKVINSTPSSLACFTSSRRAGISSSERR